MALNNQETGEEVRSIIGIGKERRYLLPDEEEHVLPAVDPSAEPEEGDAHLSAFEATGIAGDEEVAAAMRIIFDDTHNVAEGAGAAGVAAILKAKRLSGKRVATILSGGNVDREVFASVLRE